MRARAALALLACFALASSARAQERPLRTADPVPVPHGQLVVEAGIDWLDGVSYPLSGLAGDLLRAPAVGFRLGLGGLAEFQVAGGLDLLFIDERRPAPFADMVDVEGDVAHDINDPVVATKIRLREESRAWPATGLRVATRLPSAGNQSGLGNDTTDFFLWVLAAKSLGRTRVLANVGLGVLAVPERGDRQNDVLTYGFAAQRAVGERWTVALEIHGRKDTKHDAPVGTEDMGQARVGARWARGSLALDAAVIAGLHRPDPHLGGTLGLTWLREAFR